MAVFSGIVAALSFGRTADLLEQVTTESIPAILTISELAHSANSLLAAVPGLSYARDAEALSERWAALKTAEAQFADLLRGLQAQDPGSPDIAELTGLSARISGHLRDLHKALSESQRLAAQHLIQAEQLDVLAQEFRLHLQSSPSGPALAWLGEANRIMMMLGEAGRLDHYFLIDQRQRYVDDALRRLDAGRATLPTGEKLLLGSVADRLRASAGTFGLIALRRDELSRRDDADYALMRLRHLSQELDAKLAALQASAKRGIDADAARSAQDLKRSEMILVGSAAVSVLTALLVAWLYVGRALIRRLDSLNRATLAVAGGALETPIPTGADDEIGDMAQALTIFRDAMRRNRHAATHDALTNLGNRVYVEQRLGGLLAAPEAAGAVICFNLEGFKDVNETFGHNVGDRMLVAMARRLIEATRDADIVVRLGGDDFALVFPDLFDRALLMDKMREISRQIAQPVDIDGLALEIGAEFGIACYPEDGTSPAELLRAADLAMQAARSDRSEPITFYTPRLGEAIARKATVRSDLRRAIALNHLSVLYQPKVSIKDGRILGTEALVRWDHPVRGRISPAQFIPVAEASGLILPLGEWVLSEACRQTRAWAEGGLGAFRCAVNMSPVQFLRQDVVAAVRKALADTGLSPDLLEIEITEGVLMHGAEKVQSRLAELRAMGVKLAIDDFGTGYSSLSYLKRLPVDALKIDQSFVRDMLRSDEDMRINRAIIGFGHDFGLEVVAEGIETAEHHAFFQAEGCDMGQGYFYAAPMDAAAFAALVGQDNGKVMQASA